MTVTTLWEAQPGTKRKPEDSPTLIIGIAGPSASGKSSLLKSISEYLNEENVTHFDLDGYHLHTRKQRRELGEYPDEIKANDLDRIIHDIKALIEGRIIDMPVYNHKKGLFSSPLRLVPKPIVFVEGLHSILMNEISGQEVIGLSIFLCPDDDLRKSWKVGRDVSERGYAYSEAIEQIASREPFVAKYVLPQVNIADVLVLMHRKENSSVEHRVLLSPTFCDKHLNGKLIKDRLSEIFSMRVVTFGGKCYTEIHLESSAAMSDLLKDTIPRLGPLSPPRCIMRIGDRYSFTEIVEVLLVVILMMLAGR
jgi:uridine kinase